MGVRPLYPRNELSLLDLIQEGTLALIRGGRRSCARHKLALYI
jgi:hypothetical protein